MKKIQVVICGGTTCHVMGGSYLQTLEQHLQPEVRDLVQVEGTGCLSHCRDRNHTHAPFVEINGEVIEEATLPKVLEKIDYLIRVQQQEEHHD